MNIQLKSTTKIVNLNGIPCRVWEGKTESGIEVHAFIARVAIRKDEDAKEFERELLECDPPSPEINKYPRSLIL